MSYIVLAFSKTVHQLGNIREVLRVSTTAEPEEQARGACAVDRLDCTEPAIVHRLLMKVEATYCLELCLWLRLRVAIAKLGEPKQAA